MVLALLLAFAVGCTSSDERARQVSDWQETDRMEGHLPDPTVAGRTQARKFLTRTWTDSLQLHALLLEVKAMESCYIMAGEREQAAQFDSAFISTLRTVDKTLAAEIGPALKKQK